MICSLRSGDGSAKILDCIRIDMPPAPAELLKIIWCNCTTDCATARCTCKKHGMKCSMACGHCRGSSCSNANAFIEDEDDSDSAEDWNHYQFYNQYCTVSYLSFNKFFSVILKFHLYCQRIKMFLFISCKIH